jgi:AcrR family transcriptional regulator
MARVTQAHIDARTEAILDAALAQFARRGIERTTMTDIAAEAGLSTGAIYRYFSGKEQLLQAVFARALDRNRSVFEEAGRGVRSPLDALLEVGRRTLAENPCGPETVVGVEAILASARDPEGIGKRHAGIYREIFALIEETLRRARDAGELAADLDYHTLAIALTAVVPGLSAMMLVVGDEVDSDRVLSLYGELLRRTVPGRPAPPSKTP